MARKTVIIVRAESLTRKLLGSVLTDAGYDLLLAGTGSEAVLRIEQHQADGTAHLQFSITGAHVSPRNIR